MFWFTAEKGALQCPSLPGVHEPVPEGWRSPPATFHGIAARCRCLRATRNARKQLQNDASVLRQDRAPGLPFAHQHALSASCWLHA